jgi:hypothetical protein
MIKRDILKKKSKKHVRAVFRSLWPLELRERWPKWMREAIDRAEHVAGESYSMGFEDAISEVREAIEGFGRK